MTTLIRHTRGFPFRFTCKHGETTLVIINSFEKYTITEKDGDALVCEDTSAWRPGKYSFQAQNSDGVTEQGSFIVLQNLALADSLSYLSHWQTVLNAIDAVIEGRATQAQKQVRVGDKSLEYLSIDELLKLRDWVLQKVGEEKEEEGEAIASPDDQQSVKIQWRSM